MYGWRKFNWREDKPSAFWDEKKLDNHKERLLRLEANKNE